MGGQTVGLPEREKGWEVEGMRNARDKWSPVWEFRRMGIRVDKNSLIVIPFMVWKEIMLQIRGTCTLDICL